MRSDRSAIELNVAPGELKIIGAKNSKILIKIKQLLKYLGSAFVISVASYIDPGNFATNISGRAKFNY